MSRTFCSLLTIVTAVVTIASADARTWTDRTGRQVEAEFIAFNDGKVEIKRTSDGKVFQLSLDRLSDADQAFVRAQAPAETRGDPSTKDSSSIFKELRTLNRTDRPDDKDSTPISGILAFSPDGKLAVTSSKDGEQIYLSDAQTYKVLHRFKGHDGLEVTTLAFSPDGKRFASGGYDGRVCIWDIESRKEIVRFEGHRTGETFQSTKGKNYQVGSPDQVIFAPDGKQVLSFALFGDHGWRWDAATGKQLQRLALKGVVRATYSRDGRWILASLHSNGISEAVVVDAQTGREIRRLEGKFEDNQLLMDLAVTASNKHVVGFCYNPGTIHTWEIESGKEIMRLPIAAEDVQRTFYLSRDGRLAISWDQKMTKKWTTERVELGGGRFEVRATEKLLPDGDPTVHLWDVENGKLLGSKTHKGHLFDIKLTPDDLHLLLLTEKQAQVWELVARNPGK